MKFKIGDKVEILDDEYFDEKLNVSGMLCVEADTIRDMKKYAGKTAQIKDIIDDEIILDIDNGNFYWTEYEMSAA